MPAPLNGRPWKPGQSGNPSGAKLGLAAILKKRTRDGAELARFLLATMRDENQPMRVRLEAAKLALTWGFSRPPVTLEADTGGAQPLVVRWGDGASVPVMQNENGTLRRMTLDEARELADDGE